jgi:hypothetical protein
LFFTSWQVGGGFCYSMGMRMAETNEIGSRGETTTFPAPCESEYVQVPSITFRVMLHDLTSMRQRISRLEASFNNFVEEVRCGLAPPPAFVGREEEARTPKMETKPMDITFCSSNRPSKVGLSFCPTPKNTNFSIAGVVSPASLSDSGGSSLWNFLPHALATGEDVSSLGPCQIRKGCSAKTHLLDWAAKNGCSYYPVFQETGRPGEADAFGCTSHVFVQVGGHVCSSFHVGRNKKEAERLAVFDLLNRMFGIPLDRLFRDCV